MMLRLAWVLLGLVPAGLGLVVAALLGRRSGGKHPISRVASPAALLVLLLVALFHGLDSVAPGVSLASWFATAGPTTPASLSLVALKLQLVESGFFALLVIGLSLTRLGTPQEESSGRLLLAGLGGLTLLLTVLVLTLAPLSCEPVIDWATLGPLLGLALLLSGLGGATSVDVPAAAVSTGSVVHGPANAKVDAEAALRRAGVLKAEPDLIFPAKSGPERPGEAEGKSLSPTALRTIWIGCGGHGAPPAVLTKLLGVLGPSLVGAKGQWIGDLPPETLDVLSTSFLVSVLWGLGGRVLLVSPQPDADLSRLLVCRDRLGLSRAGSFVVGAGLLKEQLTSGAFPTLVILHVHELVGDSLKHLVRTNPHWLGQLDAVMLLRVDGLAPIESTHLALSLRRLSLVAGAKLGEGRRLRWLAFSECGATGRRYLEQAVGRSFDELSLGAIETAAARVFFRRRSQAREAGGGDELLSFGNVLRDAGSVVDLEDPLGELGPKDRALVPDPSHLHRSVGYHGAVSLAVCDERNLAHLYRTGSQLLRRLDGSIQLSVVWFKESPLTRFLSQPGVLAGLAERGELPTPRPLAGTDNQFLAAAHLEAALDEGEPDEAALRQAFSDAAVDDLLKARADVQRVGLRARWQSDSRQIIRSVRLSRPGSVLSEQRRQTITPVVLPIRSRHDGGLLGRVDRRLAPTRYYPHRIFAHHGQLFEVLDAVGAAATSIQVGPAPAKSLPTLPLLELRIESTGYQSSVERHRFGNLTFARAVAGITVHEEVTGVLLRGTAEPSVRYPAVSSRYDSQAVVILFEKVPNRATLFHLARVVDLLMQAHLVVEDEDVEVLALFDGLGELSRPALVIVDRHLGGLGLAGAVDAAMAHNLLRWAWGVLYSCPCMNGCEQCTPSVVRKHGADKQGVLKLLGG